MTTRHRLAALAATTGLATALLPGAAAANHVSSDDLAAACDEAPAAVTSFTDYDELSAVDRTVVDCLASGYEGDDGAILQGFDGAAALDAGVTRGQWVGILIRFMEAAGVDTGEPGENPFDDVDPDGVFGPAILKAVGLDLTQGRTETTFVPSGDLRQVELALFTYRALNVALEQAGMPALQGDGQDRPAGCGTQGEIGEACDALDDAGLLDPNFVGSDVADRRDAFQLGGAQAITYLVEQGVATDAHTGHPARILGVDVIEVSSEPTGELSSGDVVQLRLDRPVSLLDSAIEVTDDDGTRAFISCTGDATCVIDGNDVAITMTTTPTADTPGTSPGIDVSGPLLSVNTFGFSNDDGFLDVANSRRVAFGTSRDLPSPPTAAQVTASSSADRVTIANAAGLTDGASVVVYDARGQFLASGTASGGGASIDVELALGERVGVVVDESGDTVATHPTSTRTVTAG